MSAPLALWISSTRPQKSFHAEIVQKSAVSAPTVGELGITVGRKLGNCDEEACRLQGHGLLFAARY